MIAILSALLGLAATIVSAAPTALEGLEARSGVTTVSTAVVSDLTQYAQFSRAAYCPSNKISGWRCGAACDALPGFLPYLVGGNDDSIPYYFVGYWPAKSTVVVAHEGTDPTQLLSLLTDANVFFSKPSQTLFPGLSTNIKVHDGFADAHARSATAVLAAVKTLLTAYSTTKVTLVGHSLGAAISTIEMVYLKLNLPSTTTFKFVGHGSPRVGNDYFANYVDATFKDVTRINHDEDLIPIVPGRFLGYHHVSGEVHIQDSGAWKACTGQDNTDAACTTGDVGNLLEGNIVDHLGPYNGVWIGTLFCT